MVLIIFLSVGADAVAVFLAFLATLFIGYQFALGEFGMALGALVPSAAGIVFFIFTFRKLRYYISH